MKKSILIFSVLFASSLTLQARAGDDIDTGYEGIYQVTTEYVGPKGTTAFGVGLVSILKITTPLPDPVFPDLYKPLTPYLGLGVDFYQVHLIGYNGDDAFAVRKGTLDPKTNILSSVAEPNSGGVTIDLYLSVNTTDGSIAGQVTDRVREGYYRFTGKIIKPDWTNGIVEKAQKLYPNEVVMKDSFSEVTDVIKDKVKLPGVYRGFFIDNVGKIIVKASENGHISASFQAEDIEFLKYNFDGAILSENASKRGVFEMISNAGAANDTISKVVLLSYKMKDHDDEILWIGIAASTSGKYYTTLFRRVADTLDAPKFVGFPVSK